jgi:uncharacterized protein YjiS (DUF1127 family)
MTATIALLSARPRTWRRRVETREHLAALTAWQLQDVGLAPELVEREIHKPFWRPVGAMLGEAAPKSATPATDLPPALHQASRFAAVALPWRS